MNAKKGSEFGWNVFPMSKSRKHFFLVGIELNLLSAAMDLASKCIANEDAAIEESVESGTVSEDFDWESAIDPQLELMTLVARSVAYELVAIVEDHINRLATTPWNVSKSGSEVTGDLFSDEWAKSMATRKPVSSENFRNNCKRVEGYYEVCFEQIDGWSEVIALRGIVNSLKHRRGRREWKTIVAKPDWRSRNFLELDDMDDEKARQAVKECSVVSRILCK